MLILLRRDGIYYMPERVVVRKHEKVEYANNSFFTFSHNYYNQDYCFESHWHNSIEITYVVKGEKIQRMENEKIVAKTGTLLLVNSGVSHDIDVKKGIEGIVLLIDRKFINHVCPNAIGKRFDLEKNLEVKQKIINNLYYKIISSLKLALFPFLSFIQSLFNIKYSVILSYINFKILLHLLY